MGNLEPDAIEERTEAKFVPMPELRHIVPRPALASASLKYHTIGFQYVGPVDGGGTQQRCSCEGSVWCGGTPRGYAECNPSPGEIPRRAW